MRDDDLFFSKLTTGLFVLFIVGDAGTARSCGFSLAIAGTSGADEKDTVCCARTPLCAGVGLSVCCRGGVCWNRTLLEPEGAHDCHFSLKLQVAGFVKEGGLC